MKEIQKGPDGGKMDPGEKGRAKKDGENIRGAKKIALFSPFSLILLGGLLGVYGVLYVSGADRFEAALRTAGSLLVQILPVMLVVLLFMTAANLVPGAFLKKHLGSDSGFRGRLFAVLAGTFSHGPAYAWYPFLTDLRDKGVSNGKIAAFLYARAVKIPLLAAMAFYFGLSFTLVFSVLIVAGAFILGKFFDMLG